MTHPREYGGDLVIDLLDAASNLESLTPDEVRELLRDAASILCELVSPCCPSEARAAGCRRPAGNVVSIDFQKRKDT